MIALHFPRVAEGPSYQGQPRFSAKTHPLFDLRNDLKGLVSPGEVNLFFFLFPSVDVFLYSKGLILPFQRLVLTFSLRGLYKKSFRNGLPFVLLTYPGEVFNETGCYRKPCYKLPF